MAAMQIFANWFGAHLNLTYQWVVVGLALGMGFAKTQSEDTPQDDRRMSDLAQGRHRDQELNPIEERNNK